MRLETERLEDDGVGVDDVDDVLVAEGNGAVCRWLYFCVRCLGLDFVNELDCFSMAAVTPVTSM